MRTERKAEWMENKKKIARTRNRHPVGFSLGLAKSNI